MQHQEPAGPKCNGRATVVIITLIGIMVAAGMLISVFTMNKESDRPFWSVSDAQGLPGGA
mgnify:CR=1 FL=1